MGRLRRQATERSGVSEGTGTLQVTAQQAASESVGRRPGNSAGRECDSETAAVVTFAVRCPLLVSVSVRAEAGTHYYPNPRSELDNIPYMEYTTR